MNRIVHIEFYRQEKELVLYTIRLDDQEQNETDAFFERFQADPTYKEDVQIIVRAIQNLGRRGAEDRYLRDENSSHAIPVDSSRLRLYCIKGHKYCLILGGGGIKSSQSVQNSPDAFPHFQFIQKVEAAFRQCMLEKDIYWDEDELAGNLTLEIEP